MKSYTIYLGGALYGTGVWCTRKTRREARQELAYLRRLGYDGWIEEVIE